MKLAIAPLNKAANQVLDLLTKDLQFGQARKLVRDSYMDVCVQDLGDNKVSVAHYFKQNGDMVPDPDMVFLKIPHLGVWVSVSYQDAYKYNEAVVVKDGKADGIYPRKCKEMKSFADMWMKNIKEQGGGLRSLRKEVSDAEIRG